MDGQPQARDMVTGEATGKHIHQGQSKQIAREYQCKHRQKSKLSFFKKYKYTDWCKYHTVLE